MGNRGNIQVIQSDGEIWLYTHWSGSELKEVVGNALARGQTRWTDETYLTRIIFCELIGSPEELKTTTGFGIGASIGDSEHGNPTVTVNCVDHTVTIGNDIQSFTDFMNRYALAEVIEAAEMYC